MKYQSGRGLIIVLFLVIANLTAWEGLGLTEDGSSQANAAQIIPQTDPGSVVLYWTATGDDGIVGCATGYDLRYVPYYVGPIDNETKWNQAIRVSGEPIPNPFGHVDSMVINRLTPGASYYFCIKAYDEAGNYSTISNSPLVQAADGDFIAGDVNASGRIDGVDIVYLVNFLKGGPPPPEPFLRADCNGSCNVTGSDVLYLLQYLRGYGPPPFRGNCDRMLSQRSSRRPRP
jgi:hypothetical protein